MKKTKETTTELDVIILLLVVAVIGFLAGANVAKERAADDLEVLKFYIRATRHAPAEVRIDDSTTYIIRYYPL